MMMTTGERLYKVYARARHEGFTVNESVGLTGAPQSEVFQAVSRYARTWVEGMPDCLSDKEVVSLVWGEVTGVNRIACERWVNRVRSEKVK